MRDWLRLWLCCGWLGRGCVDFALDVKGAAALCVLLLLVLPQLLLLPPLLFLLLPCRPRRFSPAVIAGTVVVVEWERLGIIVLQDTILQNVGPGEDKRPFCDELFCHGKKMREADRKGRVDVRSDDDSQSECRGGLTRRRHVFV